MREDRRPVGRLFKKRGATSCAVSPDKASGGSRGSRLIVDDPRFAFDADAWAALIEEQRQTIAAAAGVEPSKIRIQIGH